MKKPVRPAIFKWRQTEPALILCAVRWYLRYSLSFRDVEELLVERGLETDDTTLWRWVQRYGPELRQRLRRHLKPATSPGRVDETYLRVKGRWGSVANRMRETEVLISGSCKSINQAAMPKSVWMNWRWPTTSPLGNHRI